MNAENTRGVCVYVKEKYDVDQVQCSNEEYKDAIWISIKSAGTTNKILVGCIYRSGTKTTAIELDPKLHSAIKDFSTKQGYDMKFLVGDFNLNNITWDPTPNIPDNLHETSPEYQFIEYIGTRLFSTSTIQHVTEPTRYRERQRPTLDDLLFSTGDSSIENLV